MDGEFTDRQHLRRKECSMRHTSLFCWRGWVVEVPHRHVAPNDHRKIDVNVVEPPDERAQDRLWREEVVTVTPHIVICTISGLEQWLVPTGGTVLAHARFFGNRKSARIFAAEFPPGQRNFTVCLQNEEEPPCILRPDPLPLPDDVGPYCVLDAFLDRWAPGSLTWYSTAMEALQSLSDLSGLTSGCMLRCAFRLDEEEVITPLTAAWLYATGRSHRMRWPISPWPPHLPPPHVPESMP